MEFTVSNVNLRDLARIFTNLSRIDDAVNWEINKNQIEITCLNSSRSGFSMVTLKKAFFDKYIFQPDSVLLTGLMTPTIRIRTQVKPILSVFRNKIFDFIPTVVTTNSKNGYGSESASRKDVIVENVQISISTGSECRIIFKFLCKHGVIKTYKISYEQTQTLHAVFDKSLSHNNFQINSKILKDLTEHFGQRTEELTIQPLQERVLLTSFTEEVVHNRDILKQPTQTTVSIDGKEFERVALNEGVSVTLSLREFRAAVILAEALGSSICAYYGVPGKPILLTFAKGKNSEIEAQFILATVVGSDEQEVSSMMGNRWQHSSTPASLFNSVERNNSLTAVAHNPPGSIGWQTDQSDSSRMFNSALDRSDETNGIKEPSTTNDAGQSLFLDGIPNESELAAFNNDVNDDAEFGPTQAEQSYHGIFSQED
ncbi:DNA repair protein rad9 [Schizosaccharomyces pombe]|uniref:DNA repair protein rad9 n=1 Tax=Schizosaccharomyces pombe (strain 972 / ATCC 24843) TaxID=284812 RepID=RAD9_SCHPO|nr:checkpoint clamp complex protein Rad9 [Schizosaccharomyces pombe]P26306.1 RecName: Full=DNA repair protein rad9 [Schizosaccharomyces pombe 972h-]CAA41189.1 rad9 protein [Schizosaccharomyces pombe]CAA45919.1 rad9 [Schizosaccharomyces pombe]CAA54491.1 rad9 [Schizosaccharomyces pombe]CAB65808.1 checkpoint clamp complex protein Rad9 [Schizosaccharomyces pombe]|eukprot:NP_593455.1 checkpoint clamp complex protein Rad9 [Schizosaccharomyces pombe]